MLHVKGITKSYSTRVVLNGLSFDLEESQLLAVTGGNGSGKSTLLKGIVGEISFDEGSVTLDKDVTWAYLPQQLPETDLNAIQYLLSVFPPLTEAFHKITSESDPFAYAEALDAFHSLGGYEVEREIDRNLAYFGFSESDGKKAMTAFSEGEKRLLGIIRLMLSGARLFLLDEPTNHLDIGHCVMLEEYILQKKEERKAFLLVSHDRAFIDRVADRTLYLERGAYFSVEGGILPSYPIKNSLFPPKSGTLKHYNARFGNWSARSRKRSNGHRKQNEKSRTIPTRTKAISAINPHVWPSAQPALPVA